MKQDIDLLEKWVLSHSNKIYQLDKRELELLLKTEKLRIEMLTDEDKRKLGPNFAEELKQSAGSDENVQLQLINAIFENLLNFYLSEVKKEYSIETWSEFNSTTKSKLASNKFKYDNGIGLGMLKSQVISKYIHLST